MRVKLLAAGLMLGCLPSAAVAAPVYLKCKIEQSDGPLDVNFVLDEAVPRVAVVVPKTGAVDQDRGTFLADRVLIKTDVAAYEISRTSLAVIRTIPMIKAVDRGTCKVEELPKRAF